MLLIEDSNVYRLKADIDLRILEACILSMRIKDVQENYMKANFAELFAGVIVEQFMGDVRLRHVDPNLTEDELPAEFIIVQEFMMVDEFFNNNKCKMPLMLKRIAGESESNH